MNRNKQLQKDKANRETQIRQEYDKHKTVLTEDKAKQKAAGSSHAHTSK